MAIREHPEIGTVLTCDFSQGFEPPEMVKRRPVIVISPKIASRAGLCTVVALSTSAPDPIMPYHQQIDIRPKLPSRWESEGVWIKGDMVFTAGLRRLDFLSYGKDRTGKRIYHYKPLEADLLKTVRSCVLRSLGLGILTKHL